LALSLAYALESRRHGQTFRLTVVSLARLDDWLGMHQHVVSLAGDVVGFIGLFIALASLMYTITNSTKAQNFGSILEIQNLIREEKEKYYGVARVQPRDQNDYELAATVSRMTIRAHQPTLGTQSLAKTRRSRCARVSFLSQSRSRHSCR